MCFRYILLHRQSKIKLCSVLILTGIVWWIFIHILLNMPSAEVEGWGINISRNVSEYILPNNTLIFPKKFCESENFLIVIIHSAPSYLAKRNAIRETWASENYVLGHSVQYYFIIGKPPNPELQEKILEESQTHRDILQEDFVDTYFNNTIKAVMWMKHIHNKCKAQFVLKSDDDMFINTKLLVKMLSKKQDSKQLLLGHLYRDTKPNHLGTWRVPKYMYSKDNYPEFLSGSAFVMSSDTVSLLYEAALKTPLIHLDDVYITGICAEVANVKPLCYPGFSREMYSFDPCIYQHLFSTHRLSLIQMRNTYALLKHTNLEEACEQQSTAERSVKEYVMQFINHDTCT